MVNDKSFEWASRRIQFETELILESLQKRRSRVGRLRSRRVEWRRPIWLASKLNNEIKISSEPSVVQYGAVYPCERAAEEHGNNCHGHISRTSAEFARRTWL